MPSLAASAASCPVCSWRPGFLLQLCSMSSTIVAKTVTPVLIGFTLLWIVGSSKEGLLAVNWIKLVLVAAVALLANSTVGQVHADYREAVVLEVPQGQSSRCGEG